MVTGWLSCIDGHQSIDRTNEHRSGFIEQTFQKELNEHMDNLRSPLHPNQNESATHKCSNKDDKDQNLVRRIEMDDTNQKLPSPHALPCKNVHFSLVCVCQTYSTGKNCARTDDVADPLEAARFQKVTEIIRIQSDNLPRGLFRQSRHHGGCQLRRRPDRQLRKRRTAYETRESTAVEDG